MTNIIKSSIQKTRDRFLIQIQEGIDRLSQRLDSLDKVQEEVQNVRQAQLQANHYQLATYNVLAEKLLNSGTVYISPSEIVSKMFTGQKIYLDPRDISVAPHLALDAIWEADITTAWLSIVRPEDIIIDIGANFGYYGVIASQQTDKKIGKVIYFEANPNLIPYIKKTLSVNWINEQSVVENLAVSDKEGTAELSIIKDYIGSSSLLSAEYMDEYMHGKMNIEAESIVSVQAVSLDSYCERIGINQVNLIKMDIEGFEDKAYDGMRKIVKASPDLTLFIEFTKDGYAQPKKFYELLLKDFGNVYVIGKDGKITKPEDTSYRHVVGYAEDWVMPIFSKRRDLASKK
jgi:FkbM family methyltransferase